MGQLDDSGNGFPPDGDLTRLLDEVRIQVGQMNLLALEACQDVVRSQQLEKAVGAVTYEIKEIASCTRRTLTALDTHLAGLPPAAAGPRTAAAYDMLAERARGVVRMVDQQCVYIDSIIGGSHRDPMVGAGDPRRRGPLGGPSHAAADLMGNAGRLTRAVEDLDQAFTLIFGPPRGP